MLAFVCVSVFNLASDTIEKLVFVCLSVCVFVRKMCVHRPISHFVNCGSIVVKKYLGNRLKVMTYFLRIFDVMVIVLYHEVV